MGLVQYDSSDEDEEVQMSVDVPPPKPAVKPPVSNSQTVSTPELTTTASSSTSTPPPPPASDPTPGPALGPVLGPALGPSRPPTQTTTKNNEQQPEEEEIDLAFLTDPTPQNSSSSDNPSQRPPSPYTRTRTLLHNLTLPAVPNMDIPPSPPGSPPPGLDTLTAKFDTFLRLKRTRGVHFNERLAQSAGMANPAVADKLLGFVGVGTEFGGGASGGGGAGAEDGGGSADADGEVVGRGVEQYATVLSAEAWDPACFPAWAYRGPLRKAQERGTKERERGRGEAVEFVAASAGGGGAAAAAALGGSGAGSAAGSRSGTPGVGGGAGRKKGRWDA